MTHQGHGEAYRRPSRAERLAAWVGRLVPAHARRHASRVYARLLARTGAGALTATLPYGEAVHLLPEYRNITWNPEEYEAFRADIGAGDTVVDVGANIGAYSVLFAQWVGPSGRVIAFEPAPEPYGALRQLIDHNGLTTRVTALQQAVSSQLGTAAFSAAGASGANRLVGAEGPATVVVETTTIDAVCSRRQLRPRLIKIDAEGAELDVLRGARETIAAGGSELRLYLEIHPQLWPHFGASREAIEAELASQQLRVERLDGDPDVWNIEGVCLRAVKCAS